MFQLARWAQKIAREMKEGTITAQYTYSEFKAKVAAIPSQTDFSRLAKYHMKEKLDGIDDDSDIEVLSGPTAYSSHSSISKKTAPSSEKRPPAKKQKTAKDEDDQYFGWSKTALMDECAEFGLSKSGSRTALIERLKGPRPPKVWLEVSSYFLRKRCLLCCFLLTVLVFLTDPSYYLPIQPVDWNAFVAQTSE